MVTKKSPKKSVKPIQTKNTRKKKTQKVSSITTEFSQDHFRVAIFGSARIKENDLRYKKFNL